MGSPLSSEVTARALVADRRRALRDLDRLAPARTDGAVVSASPAGRRAARGFALRRAVGFGLIRTGAWLAGVHRAAGVRDSGA